MLDLSTLNPPQREAVTSTEGPLLVLAGAGSGKTRVIAHRIAWLMQKGVDPESILAVTFTNKAAGEMRERVTALAGAAGVDVFVSTFHALGLWILRTEHEAAGLPRRFSICDSGDQLSIVKRCMNEFSIDDRKFDAQKVLGFISKAKSAGKSRIVPRGEGQGDDYDLVAAEVYPRYERTLKAQRAVDFDDLVCRPVHLLKKHPEILEKLQRRFRYLLVDEYQDTSAIQLSLLVQLGGERRNVCAVGDDDQSIYGWRGAEVKNVLAYERHFPGAKVIRLEQNYRSTGHVLACANAVISKNPDRRPKKLFTTAGDGDKVRVVALPGEEEEASYVAEEIARQRQEGRPYSHFAVLFRLNAQSRPFEEAFREAGIPHEVHGGPAFFDRAEVRDLLAYLKACAHPEDDVSIARIVNVPARGIGDSSLERVQHFAIEKKIGLGAAMRRAAEVPDLPRGAAERIQAFLELLDRHRPRLEGPGLAEAAKALVTEVDLYAHARSTVKSVEAGQRKVDAIDGVLRSLENHAQRAAKPSLARWLERLALDSRQEEDPVEGEGVNLLTLHAAKGLEWPVVFLVGFEEDLLPSAGIQGEARDLSEERRLCYVGITRARELLTLTRASQRIKRGKVIPRTPSRFLEDLPKASSEVIDPAAAKGTPEQVAEATASVMAALRARLGGGP